MRLDFAHSVLVQPLNRLVNDWLVGVPVLEVESLTPMAEITRHNKQSPLVLKERQQHLRVLLPLVLGDIANHQRHHRYIFVLEDLSNVGTVHF